MRYKLAKKIYSAKSKNEIMGALRHGAHTVLCYLTNIQYGLSRHSNKGHN